MPGCAVFGCNNYNRKTKGTEVKYYKFPKDEGLKNEWIRSCRRNDKINLKNATICSVHFTSNCFEIPLKLRLLNITDVNSRIRNLKNDAVPTELLPTIKKFVSKAKMDRIKRQKEKNRKEIVNLACSGLSLLTQAMPKYHQENHVEEQQLNEANVEEQQLNKANIEEQHLNEANIEKQHSYIELQARHFELQKYCIEIEKENQLLKKKLEASQKALEKIFTTGQIKHLVGNKQGRWNSDDSVSPKAYRYMRKMNFPLPGVSTLNRRALRLNVTSGVQ